MVNARVRFGRVVILAAGVAAIVIPARPAAQPAPAWLDAYRPIAQKIIAQSQSSDFAWTRLAELTDTFGNRLSGSETLERAIDWAVATMKDDGLENVHKERVMVPKWVRGRESLDLLRARAAAARDARPRRLGRHAAGRPRRPTSSIVKSFDDLDRHAADVKGKIVLFNVPFTNYGETRPLSIGRPVARGQARRDRHAGALGRAAGPAHAAHRRDRLCRGRAEDSGRRHPDRGRRSVPAARRSRRADPRAAHDGGALRAGRCSRTTSSASCAAARLPNEVLVVGGHLDSWDVGAGASDDGGGCVVTWEALRLMKTARPAAAPDRARRPVHQRGERRSRRRGLPRPAPGRTRRQHVVMLESDGGIFDPAGFGFTGPAPAKATIAAIASLLKSIGADKVTRRRRRHRHRAGRDGRQDPDARRT